MKLRRIQLENFRNYQKYDYEFEKDKDFLVLIGPNGKGKTNFLEAIYILSLGKSFRTSFPDDLVEWESEYMRCKAELEVDEESVELEVFYSKKPTKQKNFKKNNVNMRNSEYIGNLLTVLFHPEDLNILYLNPNLRRRYINILLSQTNRSYLSALSNYNKVIKHRNKLLAIIRSARFDGRDITNLKADLEAWDNQLINYGSQIIEKRINLIKFFSEKLEGFYQSISNKNEKIEIEYESKIIKTNGTLDREGISKMYKDELFNRTERDIRQALTTAGPHRDDMQFFINGKEISHTASRGEFRTLLLAIKLAEIEYIRQETGKNPVLLLDDVFSELDKTRQEHLFNSIKGCQTIITSTGLERLEGNTKNSTFIKLAE